MVNSPKGNRLKSRHLKSYLERACNMGSDDAMVDERLSVFDDEPDLNDWFEVICGSLMAVIGIFQLILRAI